MHRVTNSIKYGGKNITFITQKAVIKARCHLCGKEIIPSQGIYVVLANGQQFPGCKVHQECAQPKPPFDKNNPLVWTAGQLAEAWKEAQRYKHWFVD